MLGKGKKNSITPNSKPKKDSTDARPDSRKWDSFDMEKFFKDTDAVGKIIEERNKRSHNG